jgi:predicted PurR-regulated permease PerM
VLLVHLGKLVPRGLAILAFALLVIFVFYLFVHFMSEAVAALPKVAEKAVPMVVEFANKHGLDLPFSDSESLKTFTLDFIREQTAEVAKFAKITTTEFLYLIIGLVIACGIFANGKLDLGEASYRIANNSYSRFTARLSERFQAVFESFHTVMGAQLVISTINTFFTGLFVVGLSIAGTPLPYSFVIVMLTFLCGILPIVGNLISNTVIFSVALTQSPKLAIAALLYLIALHKFEYFLNSKIIGGRIKNPMWLTLIGLVVGERIMGIPGMILTPVVLHLVKSEAGAIEVRPDGAV